MKKYYYDGDVIRWRNLDDNKDYCIHIKQDSNPLDPRADDDGIFANMACFVRGYSIGDKISGSAEEYWQSLVREHLTEKEIIDAVKAGKIKGIRIAANEERDSTATISWKTASTVKSGMALRKLLTRIAAQKEPPRIVRIWSLLQGSVSRREE